MHCTTFALVGTLAVLALACTAPAAGPTVTVCTALVDQCTCTVQEGPATRDASSSTPCNSTAYPDTTCCADDSWPSSGSCLCYTGSVYCGVVQDAFTSGEAGCVCSSPPQSASQVIGATCYPGGTTTSSMLGICCTFTDGTCACAAGLHTCESTGTQVATCSAANFPAPTSGCSGQTQVKSCS
jgi:hypothetical protein